MIRQLAPERPAALEFSAEAPSATGLVAAAAAVRGVAVAASGLILTAGLSMVLWAVTPSSGADVVPALQGGVVAYAAANLMPVLIGGIPFTLPPLLLTLAIAALLASTARRGRFLPQGRYQESVAVLVTASVYGLVVAATTRGLGPPGAVPAGWVWTAAALAFVATASSMLRSGSAWHEWWITVAPGWARIGVRGGGIGTGVMIAGGGLALSVGLVTHFGAAVSVAELAASSWLDGLGMAMLGVAYVPNAVIAGAGYVSGVGFQVGAGTYSPFGTSTVDLPAVPLLAAAPDHPGRSWIGIAFLLVPVIAGYLIARPAIRNLATRADRVLATAVGAGLTGGLLAAAAVIAGGGVAKGRWAVMGAPPALLAMVVAVEVGVVAIAVAALAGGRSMPWQLRKPAGEAATATTRPQKPSTVVAGATDVDGTGTVEDVGAAGDAHDSVSDPGDPDDGDPASADPASADPDDGDADDDDLGDGESDVPDGDVPATAEAAEAAAAESADAAPDGSATDTSGEV